MKEPSINLAYLPNALFQPLALTTPQENAALLSRQLERLLWVYRSPRARQQRFASIQLLQFDPQTIT